MKQQINEAEFAERVKNAMVVDSEYFPSQAMKTTIIKFDNGCIFTLVRGQNDVLLPQFWSDDNVLQEKRIFTAPPTNVPTTTVATTARERAVNSLNQLMFRQPQMQHDESDFDDEDEDINEDEVPNVDSLADKARQMFPSMGSGSAAPIINNPMAGRKFKRFVTSRGIESVRPVKG